MKGGGGFLLRAAAIFSIAVVTEPGVQNIRAACSTSSGSVSVQCSSSPRLTNQRNTPERSRMARPVAPSIPPAQEVPQPAVAVGIRCGLNAGLHATGGRIAGKQVEELRVPAEPALSWRFCGVDQLRACTGSARAEPRCNPGEPRGRVQDETNGPAAKGVYSRCGRGEDAMAVRARGGIGRREGLRIRKLAILRHPVPSSVITASPLLALIEMRFSPVIT